MLESIVLILICIACEIVLVAFAYMLTLFKMTTLQFNLLKYFLLIPIYAIFDIVAFGLILI